MSCRGQVSASGRMRHPVLTPTRRCRALCVALLQHRRYASKTEASLWLILLELAGSRMYVLLISPFLILAAGKRDWEPAPTS